MLSFRQKIFTTYAIVFLIFIVLMVPVISHWVHHLVIQTMEGRAIEVISHIQDAPNNEALVRRLKDQKSAIFFRVGLITNESKVLYDSHTKRILGPKFNTDYVINHPEVNQALKNGVGYYEDYSKLLNQKYSYLAKAFNFHGQTYVLRTAFPFSYVSQLAHEFEIGFIGFAAAILLLFSCMTWIVIHRLTKPIQKIITAIKPYQEGTQTALPRINLGNINPEDDFAKLALTLNNLSRKIQGHIDSLTNERNEKEAILESLEEGVVAIDQRMEVSYINNTATKLLSVNKDLTGTRFTVPGKEVYFDILERCQTEQKPLMATLEVFIEGKKKYLDIIAAPKKGDGGSVLVLQDKTSHYKIFEMRRDFIANASHELKTPITIIRGFAEALHDNPDLPRETQVEVTAKIVRNCERMAVLIKDLLTLADIENIPTSRLSICDITELCQNCINMLLEAFPEADIQIVKPSKDITLIADAYLLDHAIMNLIVNAAKYSSKPAHIRVILEDDEKWVSISIQDKGIGIPEADQEHVFDRFYTVNKAHSQKLGGSGLGLSIVKTIIEKHLGTISLTSELGKGTTFKIVLPKRNLQIEE